MTETAAIRARRRDCSEPSLTPTCPRCGDLCDGATTTCAGCGARLKPTAADLELARNAGKTCR